MTSLSLFTALDTAPGAVQTMSTREIAAVTKKDHSNIKISADRLSARGVIGTLALQEFDHNGNTYTEYLLNKRDSIILVAQNCPEFTAAIVDRWEALETGKAAPTAAAPAPIMHTDPAARAVVLAGVIADTLRLYGSARIGIVRSAIQLTAPELLPMLPSYAIDAPEKSGALTSGSSEPTFSATHLLKEHGAKISAVAFNKMLRECGMLSHENRRASNGRLKAFWSVTDKGMAFGKNVSSDKNPRETQPHWYASKFAQLLAAAGVMQ